MLSILIIEDEYWTLEGLKKTFEWDRYNISHVDYCLNPVEGLNLALTNHYDAVFTDIRMPEIDGLELIQKCRDKQIKSEFVILSGYSEFEYAQDALKMNVYDYLLKPINSKKANLLLKKLTDNLLAKRISDNLDLLDALQSGQDSKTNLFISQNTTIFSGSYQVAWIEVYDSNNYPASPIFSNMISLYFGLGRSLIFFDSKLFETIQSYYEKKHNHYSIGLSTKSTSHSQIAPMIREAISSNTYLFLKSEHTIFTYSAPNFMTLKSLLVDSFKFIELPDNTAFKKSLDEFAMYCKTRRPNIDYIHYFWTQIITKIVFIWDEVYYMDENWLRTTTQFKNHFSDVDQMVTYLKTLADYLKQASESHLSPNISPISAILKYIGEHFTESIQLTDIANVFFINLSYLSTLIKKETGKTYSTYITELRINKAIQLMSKQELTTEEIASLSGYNDYYYFNKVFKKHTGSTPYKYRQVINNQVGEKVE